MKMVLACLLPLFSNLIGLSQPYMENKTYTYQEAISTYAQLAKNNNNAKLIAKGGSDVGEPLHLFVITNDGDFNPTTIKEKNKRVLLINNAIHAGESCGVDACIKLAEDLLKNDHENILEHVVVCIIPGYNIGGMLNRNSTTRTGQKGPEEYGFRGNAKNLDLNRDFIKCDSRNTLSFTAIYHEWQPDVFIDTHTTNGTDFQYNMSIITTQPDKLTSEVRDYVRKHMNPAIYKSMNDANYEITPYVSALDKTPDNGFKDYLETPRYSTGYTALFNTIGYVTEAHKYKPYKNRVEYTYQFILKTAVWMNQDYERLGSIRKAAAKHNRTKTNFDILWEPDTLTYDSVNFKGYEVNHKSSAITGQEIHYYNHENTYSKEIKYFDRYQAVKTVEKPKAYLIPQGYIKVITRLQLNNIEMEKIKKDTLMEVEAYYIKSYETVKNPYESHYLHYNVQLKKEKQRVQLYKGDWIIHPNQEENRYIIETLEPDAHDSFFAWNFFDGILQQKEWFSSWHFDDEAAQILSENPALKAEFEQKKQEDIKFAKSHFDQLYFIYKQSDHYEVTHNRYPVYRL
jgi:hypothetical protein